MPAESSHVKMYTVSAKILVSEDMYFKCEKKIGIPEGSDCSSHFFNFVTEAFRGSETPDLHLYNPTSGS